VINAWAFLNYWGRARARAAPLSLRLCECCGLEPLCILPSFCHDYIPCESDETEIFILYFILEICEDTLACSSIYNLVLFCL